MKYETFILSFYDSKIEEENNCGICLSTKTAKNQEKYGIWISSVYLQSKSNILDFLWDRDDIDDFVIKYPESKSWVFKMNHPDLPGRKSKSIDYCPISNQREEKIESILVDSICD